MTERLPVLLSFKTSVNHPYGVVEHNGHVLPAKWAKIHLAVGCWPSAEVMLDVNALEIVEAMGVLYTDIGGRRYKLVDCPWPKDTGAEAIIPTGGTKRETPLS